jgi:hypothetical protein
MVTKKNKVPTQVSCTLQTYLKMIDDGGNLVNNSNINMVWSLILLCIPYTNQQNTHLCVHITYLLEIDWCILIDWLKSLLRAYSQLGYPRGRFNKKRIANDYFGFLLHIIFHGCNGLVYDYN